MDNSMVPVGQKKLEATYNNACKPYGVSCKAFTVNKYAFSNEKETYLAFSASHIPEDLDVKDIYIRNERSNSLFYTDCYVIKLDENASPLGMVDEAVAYCRTVDFLKKLFSEFETKLPNVVRGSEIRALKEYNLGRKNRSLPLGAREKYQKGLKKFFKQENTRSKYLQQWRAFSRTDKYDVKASPLKMFRDFHNRNKQLTELARLNESNNDLKTTLINEHEFVKFQKLMEQYYPDVLFSVSKLDKQSSGFDESNKDKPVSNIKSGPFGKLVSYETFCEEREKRFATEGFDAILDLHPVYYETRQLTYKEVDEPFIAGVLNSIRFAYAKSNELYEVRNPNIDSFSYIDLPVGDMMNFVSMAKANNLPFYLDFFGKFGKSNLDSVRVIYSPSKEKLMKAIIKDLVDFKFKNSHILTTLDNPSSSLDKQIDDAQHIKLNSTQKRSLERESRTSR